MNRKSERKLISPKGGAGAPVPGPGRRKGSRNKISHTAKENISKVFDMLGGIDGLHRWANRNDHNRAIFYQSLYSKIIPMEHEHSGQINGKQSLTIRVVQIKDENGNGNSGK